MTNVNKSLAFLNKVILELAENANAKSERAINFRNSKLTQILTNSLVGDSSTAFICTISMAALSGTKDTLSFASNAKKASNKFVATDVVSEEQQNATHDQFGDDLSSIVQNDESLDSLIHGSVSVIFRSEPI